MLELATITFALGSMPFFASRTFSAWFWVALLARLQAEGMVAFGGELGPLQVDLSLIVPPWLIADGTLGVLLLLMLVEMAADKNPDLRLLVEEFNPLVRAGGDYLFNSVALGANLAVVAAAGVQYAGISGALWAVIPAAGVWLIAVLRRSVFSALTDLDEDDDLGIRKLISWAEDGWVGGGVFFLVVMPILALTVAGLTVAGLAVIQLWLREREKKSKVPCAHCGTQILPSAPTCFSCRKPVARPVTVGAFGQPKTAPATDLGEHQLRLLSKKRCIVCATRLGQKRLRQECGTCGSQMLPSRAWADRYLAYVQSKLPQTLAVSAAFSLVPVIGIIPGVIYYRLGLISALRTYVPPTTGCVTRWVVRIGNLILLAFQWVPIIGALMLPAMCLLNYSIYRHVLVGQKEKLFAYEEQEPAPA